jgi:hypothetical protein
MMAAGQCVLGANAFIKIITLMPANTVGSCQVLAGCSFNIPLMNWACFPDVVLNKHKRFVNVPHATAGDQSKA